MKKKVLNRKVSKIGIDYDHTNLWKLVQNYFKIEMDHPDSEVEVFISSGKRGFHIVIHKEVTVLENLLYRAKYDDCGTRLKLSISKLLMDENADVDILFEKKGEKEGRKIDIKKMIGLDRYTEVLRNYGNDKSFNLMCEIAKDLKDRLLKRKLKIRNPICFDYYLDYD